MQAQNGNAFAIDEPHKFGSKLSDGLFEKENLIVCNSHCSYDKNSPIVQQILSSCRYLSLQSISPQSPPGTDMLSCNEQYPQLKELLRGESTVNRTGRFIPHIFSTVWECSYFVKLEGYGTTHTFNCGLDL